MSTARQATPVLLALALVLLAGVVCCAVPVPLALLFARPVTALDAAMVPRVRPGDRVIVPYREGPWPRGAVVAVRRPGGPVLRRIVGVPGDIVAVDNDQVLLEGTPVPIRGLGQIGWTDSQCGVHASTLARERLDGLEHPVLLEGTEWSRSDALPQRVPPGHVFLLGDNRPSSQDSRHWGPIPVEELLGPAWRVLVSVDPCTGHVRLHRTGRRIRSASRPTGG